MPTSFGPVLTVLPTLSQPASRPYCPPHWQIDQADFRMLPCNITRPFELPIGIVSACVSDGPGRGGAQEERRTRSNVRATAQPRWSERFGGIPRPEILTCGHRITTSTKYEIDEIKATASKEERPHRIRRFSVPMLWRGPAPFCTHRDEVIAIVPKSHRNTPCLICA
jgi:hypothetical protein